jgi:hypothetical protein
MIEDRCAALDHIGNAVGSALRRTTTESLITRMAKKVATRGQFDPQIRKSSCRAMSVDRSSRNPGTRACLEAGRGLRIDRSGLAYRQRSMLGTVAPGKRRSAGDFRQKWGIFSVKGSTTRSRQCSALRSR